MTLKELLAAYKAKSLELKNILDKGEDATEEDVAAAAALDTELEALDGKIEDAKAHNALAAKNAERNARVNTPATPALQPEGGDADRPGGTAKDGNTAGGGGAAPIKIVIPAGVHKTRLKHFKTHEQAYGFGMYILAVVGKNLNAIKWCEQHGIDLKVATEGNNGNGGVLVPTEYDDTIIDLRESYGVFRQYAHVVGMKTDTKVVRRRVAGLTAYPVGEGQAPPDSTKSWNLVELVARKWAVLAFLTSELDEDSVIDLGDDAVSEIAYAFAHAEDNAGFNGDGTGAYHKITGLRTRFKSLSATRANIAGLQVGSSGTWGGLLLSDFDDVQGKLPEYVSKKGTPRWFCSKVFYESVMKRLMFAAGGVTAAELSAGISKQTFMGYEVVIAQALPTATALDDIPVFFGDLSLAASFGNRRETTVAMSDQFKFDTDEVAVRGTERYDINVHDVGNADPTAANQVPGPVVGLITAAA